METEPEKLQEEAAEQKATSDLARKERIRSWRFVYMFGCFFFPIGMVIEGFATHQYQPEGAITSIVFVPIVILMLPIGLACDFGYLVDHMFLNIDSGYLYGLKCVLELLTFPLSFVIFLVHYQLTSEAKTRRTFFLLMLSLVLLVCGSLVGCVREASQPIGMQN